ncbi:MAG TPA: glycosyltransferase family 4 protein [Bryobacteraceae bacterium]|jgi:glycosyltransferase involved in cell wall biosynthesis|nr:glycosyltransferase family 4 protein [Bryobacteraceae bacterium]
MRTLHVDTGRRMQGGQWQVVYLLEKLERATLLAAAGSPLLEEARKRGIDAEELSLLKLRRYAPVADVIHAHDARGHTFAALAASGPLVVSRRVAFPVSQSVASKWKYGRATLFLAVSNFVAEKLVEAGVNREKIRVVYDGVPLPPSLSNRTPKRVVALAGKCEDLVRAAGAEAGVAIHFTSNLWEDLSTASVFIYASALEGLGSAALAAMAAGVPVIACGQGGLSEAVEHQKTGLVTAPQEIGAALIRLLSDPQYADQLGKQGRERVERKFTIEAMVEATRKAYAEVAR